MDITALFQRSRTWWIATGILASVVFLWSGLAWSQGKGGERDAEEAEKTPVEMAESAQITIQEAIQVASAEVPGKVVEAELDEKPVVVWEVEIVTDEGKVMQLYVDIRTGAVIETMEKKPEKEAEKEGEQQPHRKGCMSGMMHEGGMGAMQKQQ